MPLGKADNPNTSKTETDDKATDAAVEKVIDAGAGAPDALRQAAEDLPERNEVQKAIKEGMLATDAQTEAKAKAKVVDLSPDSADTPSGYALKETAGIADDIERGEEYARIKAAKRQGYVPSTEADLKARK
jgi:hypothetical protein